MATLCASLPSGAAGNWCKITANLPSGPLWWAKLQAEDSARGHVVREAFLGVCRVRGGYGRRSVLVHVPRQSQALTLHVFSDKAAAPALSLRRLSRIGAACALLAHGWRKLPSALRGDARGRFGRLRAVLGQAPARGGEAPPYRVWIDLFDAWGERELAALAASGAPGASFEVAVVAVGEPDALAATRRSLPAHWPVRVIDGQADWRGLGADWILVVEAGEILAAQAGACFSLAVRRQPDARGFCADLDTIDPAGLRRKPELRPPPDPWLLQTDFFGRGAWLFHRRSHENLWPRLPANADQARLALARATPAESLRHVSLILTHCPPRPRRSAELPWRPLGAATPRVSVIVPSSCRSRHVLRCLRRLLATTAYPDFEILIAASGIATASRTQKKIMRRLATLPHVRVIDSGIEIFNYAAVNNRVAARAQGDLLLLLNDDVVPIAPDWLHRMVTYVCGQNGPIAHIVGARLLYGNSMVQHGGVIMGLANLCEHAFRLTDDRDSGPQHLAKLDRRVSAVTAACMLMRRSLYESLGGLDESFAIALNDVDFCLRAGLAGASIVQAASVELYHFESMSLGRHYQGGRAHLEAIEVRRLRQRWGATISADPYYHPCASLELGREFQPGFPPRQTPLSWISEDTLAPA